jgi:CRP-like cAMP-binding protein
LKPAKLRELMADQQIALSVIALVAKQGRQREQHIVALARLDAHARIAAFLLGIYDRLRERELVTRPRFTLGLTQDQIADHLGLAMVHVNRTLRRLREERLALVDRQVVIIADLAGLRRVAAGGEESVDEIGGPVTRPD